MAYFWQTQMSSKQPSYLDVLKQKEQEKKKINLFDFSDIKTSQPAQTKQMNFWTPMSWENITNFSDFKANIPTQTQPTQKSGFSLFPTVNAWNENIIQTFLNDSKTQPDLWSKRNAVIEMLKNWEDEAFIEDVIINKMWYTWPKPQEEQPWFLSKVWQWFTDISRNIYEWVENVWADVINVWLSAFWKEPIKPMREQLIPTWEEYKWWLLKRSVDTIWKRWTESWEILTESWEWNQTQAEWVFQWVAKVGRWILDIAWDTFMSWLSTLTPDKQKEQITNLITNIAQTEWWQQAIETAKTLSNKYKEFKTNNPRAWRNVDAIWTFIEWALEIAWVWLTWKWITKWVEKTIDLWSTWIEKKWWKQILKTPTLIKKWAETTTDVIDTWVEKVATKILGSSDWTKELFKATSPSYNTLSKNKDITKIVNNAKKADETIVKYWFKPTNTTERVKAYNDTMKKVWADIEKTRGWVSTKFDAWDIAKTIDDEIQKLSVWWVINPAIQKDITALQKQADYFRKIWKIDIPTLWNQRTLINAITDWWQTTEFWNTFSNVMKKVWWKIREIEDDIITKAWKWTTWDKLKEYWALRSIYDDIVKQDIKALRAKWMAIDESFWRIAWISEALWWIAQLFTQPKQALPTILSWWSKLLLWKTAWKLKDADFLIKTWYEKLSKTLKSNLKKNVNNVDNNISTAIKYSEKPTKISWQKQVKLLKPNQPTNVSNKPTILKPKETAPTTPLKTKPFNKSETIKKLQTLTKDNVDDVVKSITTDKTKLAQVKQVIEKYLKEYWENIKNYLWLLADDIADIVWGRVKLLWWEKAKLFDKSRWEQAKEMTKAGKSADEVWQKTWWEKWTDWKWKFEIDDSDMAIKIKQKDIDNLFTWKLSDVIDHPTLFKQYPEARNINIEFVKWLDSWWSFIEKTNTLKINADLDLMDTFKTIPHEIQHYIQSKEWFARGGSVSKHINFEWNKELDMLYSDYRKWNNYLQELKKWKEVILDKWKPYEYKLSLSKTKEMVDNLDYKINNLENNLKSEMEQKNISDYKSLAWETEARNVQSRLLKTPAERKILRPAKTEDVERKNQIIKMEWWKSMLLPTNPKQVSKSDDLISEAKKFKSADEFIKDKIEFERGWEIRVSNWEAWKWIYMFPKWSKWFKEYYVSDKNPLVYSSLKKWSKIEDLIKRQQDVKDYLNYYFNEKSSEIWKWYIKPKITNDNWWTFWDWIESYIKERWLNIDWYIVPHKGYWLPTWKQVIIKNEKALNTISDKELKQIYEQSKPKILKPKLIKAK